jgi:benzoylsuccinyl-CoA thiolase BbsB subunit
LREVSVIGVGMARFGKYPAAKLADLAVPAVKAALADANVPPHSIQMAVCGTALGGMLAGQRILKEIGLTGMPILNVENACSSGSSALHHAWLAIAGGQYDCALVVGVEKLSRLGGGPIPLEQEDWEVANGLTMPALYAMRAQRYMHECGASSEDLAQVAVKSRAHGALNPYSQFRHPVTVEEVLASRPIAEPLTLFQCCPTGDGAAALVLAATRVAKRFGSRPIRVLASKLNSGTFTAGFRDMTTPEITVRGAREAYAMAGVGPDDIDVAEVHDAFTIAELLYCEALGFCERGEAVGLLWRGETSIGGRIPVNPSGGLLSRGHPLGATGVAQVVEVVLQLRGECRDLQVEGARVGLAHTTGGGVSGLDHGACSIHIFAR